MTICMAAIAEEKYIACISDKIVTLSNPSTEFEQDGSKTHCIDKRSIFASAGLALEALPILEDVRGKIKDSFSIDQICNLVQKSYEHQRNSNINELFLKKFGLTVDIFVTNQKTLDPNIINTIYQTLNAWKYDLTVMIAGVDKNGPHIFTIENPVKKNNHDMLAHCHIGSGGVHAFSSFISNQYHPKLSLNRVLGIVYEAKKRSEEATGVGEKSDMYIISEQGTKKLSDSDLLKLDLYYSNKLKRHNENLLKSTEEVNKLCFDL